MSTPITEAHRALWTKLYNLAHDEIFEVASSDGPAHKLIADSEARAVAARTAERDQLRAEVERLKKQAVFDGEHVHELNSAFATRAELTAERERVRVLREALENLRDEQNGAPLCTRDEQWTQAMDRADAALAATEESK